MSTFTQYYGQPVWIALWGKSRVIMETDLGYRMWSQDDLSSLPFIECRVSENLYHLSHLFDAIENDCCHLRRCYDDDDEWPEDVDCYTYDYNGGVVSINDDEYFLRDKYSALKKYPGSTSVLVPSTRVWLKWENNYLIFQPIREVSITEISQFDDIIALYVKPYGEVRTMVVE